MTADAGWHVHTHQQHVVREQFSKGQVLRNTEQKVQVSGHTQDVWSCYSFDWLTVKHSCSAACCERWCVHDEKVPTSGNSGLGVCTTRISRSLARNVCIHMIHV
jgi:hypothetical protein